MYFEQVGEYTIKFEERTQEDYDIWFDYGRDGYVILPGVIGLVDHGDGQEQMALLTLHVPSNKEYLSDEEFFKLVCSYSAILTNKCYLRVSA